MEWNLGAGKWVEYKVWNVANVCMEHGMEHDAVLSTWGVRNTWYAGCTEHIEETQPKQRETF